MFVIRRLHRERQQAEKEAAGGKWQDYDLIFPTNLGAPMHPRNLLRDFKGQLAKAGLPELRIHDLRHTAASLMLMKNIPVIVVSKRLGHSRPSITHDTYGHLIPSMEDPAADLMDRITTPVAIGSAILTSNMEATTVRSG